MLIINLHLVFKMYKWIHIELHLQALKWIFPSANHSKTSHSKVNPRCLLFPGSLLSGKQWLNSRRYLRHLMSTIFFTFFFFFPGVWKVLNFWIRFHTYIHTTASGISNFATSTRIKKEGSSLWFYPLRWIALKCGFALKLSLSIQKLYQGICRYASWSYNNWPMVYEHSFFLSPQ